MGINVMVKTGESETQQRRAAAYAAAIGGASSTTRLAVVRMDIEEAAGCDAITQEQAAGLMRDLDAKVREAAPRELLQASQQEFHCAARALCPGGQGACKLGINVTIVEDGAALKTCRQNCAVGVDLNANSNPEQLGEVELAKRKRLDAASAAASIRRITVDSFEH